MEDNCVIKPDVIEDSLYVSQEDLFGVEFDYRGFKKQFLLHDLTEIEQKLLLCTNCEGIIRDASTFEGEMTCNLCSHSENNAKPVNNVRTSVANLGVKCPLLRDCDWTGQLSEAESHLLICGSAFVLCPLGCESVLRRCKIEEHTINECPLRNVVCEFCEKIFSYEDLAGHLDLCPEHPIICECKIEFPRSKQEVHIETECPLAEVECPYAKYSCSFGKMLRKDVEAHKKTYFIEHQDMLQTEFEEERERFKERLMRTKDLDGFEWKIDNFESITFGNEIEGPPFHIGNSEFICVLIPGENLSISMRKSEKNIHLKEKIEICITESRLILEKSLKMNKNYLDINKSKYKISLGKTSETLFILQESLYSKYVQPDNSLCLRMYFDFANKIRKKEKTSQVFNGKD